MSVSPHTGQVVWDPDELQALALSRPSEALAAAREVLAQHPSASQAAVAHQAAGVVLRHFGDISEAIDELKQAYRFARKAGDRARESDILASLGVAQLLAGTVLSVGTAEPRKDLPGLVRAFDRLAVTDVALVLAGPPSAACPSSTKYCATATASQLAGS